MAQTILKPGDRQAGRDWDSYYESYIASVSSALNENEAEKKKRIEKLEANFEDWKEYYFPRYCYAPSASFHKKAAKREINNPEWYESRIWARELAKDVTEMMVTLYQVLTRRKSNILFISNSNEKASELLEPYRINLTSNERITNDYGIQQNPGKWTYGDFVTTQGASFLAVGADQSPRGSRNEEVRPDKVIISDIDTDQEVLNPEIIKKRWEWFEGAVFPTRSVSKDFQVIWLGNLIAKDCCVARAREKADFVSIVNLEDENGNSTWPEKNSRENIERIKSKISTASYQREYMNNPAKKGTTFKDMVWGKCPPLSSMPFVICYGDPSPSNAENKPNSYKAVFLIGKKEHKYYIYTGFLAHPVNEDFCRWFYKIDKYNKNRTQVYNFIENNSLQDPFYQQVIKPLFKKVATEEGYDLPIGTDGRQKPKKFPRIEGNLEPLHRDGNLIFNEDEKDNPHMKKLEEQFEDVNPQLSLPADGPDCIEGGIWILNEKSAELSADQFKSFPKKPNSKRM